MPASRRNTMMPRLGATIAFALGAPGCAITVSSATVAAADAPPANAVDAAATLEPRFVCTNADLALGCICDGGCGPVQFCQTPNPFFNGGASAPYRCTWPERVTDAGALCRYYELATCDDPYQRACRCVYRRLHP